MTRCKNPLCENTVSERMEAGFCFNCLADLQRDSMDMEKELGHLLYLEAQFVRYCEEHGLPNPHD